MLLNYGAGEDSWRVPWAARTSNQSMLKEINPEYSLEGLMLKLKLQYFGYLMWRVSSLEKTLMLRKIESRRKWGQQDEMVGWHYPLSEHEYEQISGGSKGQWSLMCYSPWGHHLVTEQNQWEREFEAINLTEEKNIILPVEIFILPLIFNLCILIYLTGTSFIQW